MSDVFTRKKRSQIMAAIGSYGNRNTEMRLAAIFRANGITGWRRRQRLLGNPDFVFHRQRLAVFVDGCFWHGCRQHLRMPQHNRRYWQHKITKNAARDRTTTRRLRNSAWRVLRVWEHSLRSPAAVAKRIKSALRIAEDTCKSVRAIR